MGALTFLQICEQGALVGQNNATPDWVAIKMKAWLRKHYAAWPWPFLMKQATGITLAAAASSKVVGGGTGGLTPQVSRIFSPIYFRADGYSTRGKAHIRVIAGDDLSTAIGQVNPSTEVGAPQSFIVLPEDSGDGLMRMILYPYPFPDKDYSLSFSYTKMPENPASGDYVVYPNDMTLLQAAKVAALEYDQTNDPVYLQEANILAGMVTADRGVYGTTNSFGDVMQLDSSIFLP